jgi:hypothetical protein
MMLKMQNNEKREKDTKKIIESLLEGEGEVVEIEHVFKKVSGKRFFWTFSMSTGATKHDTIRLC